MSDTKTQVMELDQQYVMHTYGKLPVVFVRGEGCYLYDPDGKRYIDMVAGIAVNGLGHCPPHVTDAICAQARNLMHTSNLYYTPQQPALAKLLCGISGMSKAFFCNSGAEANEAAIKLARKAGKKHLDTKINIITAEKSFHGRTMGAITATGQPKYQKSFLPLVPGFKYVPYNDEAALEAVVDESTCAVILEPVQGESGVHAASQGFMAKARELCDKFKVALVFDEVQTGLGRTGKMFGFEHFSIKPDIMTLSKMLGGGFPIGACLATNGYEDVFEPGDHASTFGGSPLASAAAIAAVTEIRDGGWVRNADRVGAYLRSRLAEMPGVKEVRGLGLMIAAEFDTPVAKSVATAAMDMGLIVNPIGDNVLRFVPPLILTEQIVDEAIVVLAGAIGRAG